MAHLENVAKAWGRCDTQCLWSVAGACDVVRLRIARVLLYVQAECDVVDACAMWAVW